MKKIIAASILSLAVAACTTTDPYTGETKTSNTARNAGIGAVVGAVAGAVVNDDEAEGAAYGAILGAAIGGGIGAYMDRQEAELRRELASSGVKVIRTGNDIQLVMPGNVTFASSSEQLQPNFLDTLNDVSTVLAKFNDTNIEVAGFTDSTGADDYNLALSIRRSETVGNYLVSQGVNATRIDAIGYGETRFIADNNTESGKQANRRVEIQITPTQQGS